MTFRDHPRAGMERAIPWLLIVVLLAPSLRWIVLDRSIWPWDQSYYAEVTVDLWYWLGRSGRQWLDAMLGGLPSKPPAILWLGQIFVPLRSLLGSVESALLLSVLLAHGVTLLLLYRIGVTLCPRSPLVAILGVVFAAGGQLVVGLSHQYLVEPLQAASVTWVFLVATSVGTWPRAKLLLHLVSALILGALAKTTTPVYCALPALYAAASLRRPGPAGARARPWPSRGLLVACVVIGSLGVAWYLRNAAQVWAHARESASGDVALHYGYRAPLLQKLVTWSGLTRQAFLAPFSGWGVCGLLVSWLIALGTRPATPSRGTAPRALIPLCVAQIALVLVSFSLNVTVEARYLLPLLPSLALPVMLLAASLPWRAAAVGLTAVFLYQWITVQRAAAGSRELIAGRSQYLLPLERDGSRYGELARVVAATSQRPGGFVIVGVEEPWLNANSASFFAAKHRLSTGAGARYASLGYAEKDLGAALRRIEGSGSPFVVTLDEAHQPYPPDFLNQVSLPVLRALRADPRFRVVPFDSRHGICIFERRE